MEEFWKLLATAGLGSVIVLPLQGMNHVYIKPPEVVVAGVPCEEPEYHLPEQKPEDMARRIASATATNATSGFIPLSGYLGRL